MFECVTIAYYVVALHWPIALRGRARAAAAAARSNVRGCVGVDISSLAFGFTKSTDKITKARARDDDDIERDKAKGSLGRDTGAGCPLQ